MYYTFNRINGVSTTIFLSGKIVGVTCFYSVLNILETTANYLCFPFAKSKSIYVFK